MTIKARLDKLEAARAVDDWRPYLPPGVTVEEAEKVKFTLAKILAAYADDHNIQDVTAIPSATVNRLFTQWARGMVEEAADLTEEAADDDD